MGYNKTKTKLDKAVSILQFAVDKCVSRNAGNLQNPYAYLRKADWDEFERRVKEIMKE